MGSLMESPILGHAALRAQLTASVGGANHHHGWLLHGPVGIGKSLLAEEMAMAYLCQGEATRPCRRCHGCHMMAADSHPDAMLLQREEGKRDIPVTKVRELLGFLALTGRESRRRVAIIDDAERLNKAAANALLKGLEEPAESCLLILVCSDLARLPPTIRSRCMLQQCHALDDATTRAVLQRIGIPEAALAMATTLAQGQPGRCACLLERDWCQRLQRWQRLTEDLARCDIGALQQLVAGKWPPAPLTLAVAMVLEQARPLLTRLPFPLAERALAVCTQLAEIPARAERQTLRCDQALLGSMIELRRLVARA